jgi:uncharacterized protein (DUF433 family)
MPVLPINHIASDPSYRSGRARVVGTGITVHFLAGYLEETCSVEEICKLHDLTPGQIYAAWSYYYDHKAEIDAQRREDDEAIDALPSIREHIERKKSKTGQSTLQSSSD